MPTYTTVEQYIDSQPLKTKEALKSLIESILFVLPEAVALINYNIIAFGLTKESKRDNQIMIAGYKNHVGLYPGVETISKFQKQLIFYTQGKGSVQFPLNTPLPRELIIEMLRYWKGLH